MIVYKEYLLVNIFKVQRVVFIDIYCQSNVLVNFKRYQGQPQGIGQKF